MAKVYNPSKWGPRVAICLVAAIPVPIATYMGLFQWGLIDSFWDPFFGKETEGVLKSELSHEMQDIIRLPDAILGAVAYIGDIIFALAGSNRRWFDRPWLVALFGLDVIPVSLVSATLVFMQAFVVHSWCFLCLVTACFSLVLVLLSYDEVFASITFMHRVWKRSRSKRVVWNTFIGKPSKLAYEIAREIEKNGRKS